MFRLTCILFLLFVTYQFVQATNSLPREGCVDGCSKRTLISIIWGCLSTTIICAWAALHPNIPPQEGPLKRGLRRLELMFWTIVAPEILPCWAVNQRLAAMTVRDVYNKAKDYKRDGIWKRLKGWFSLYEITEAVNPAWTLKHGHFLIMGGIHLVEPAEPEGNSTSSEAPMETEQGVTNVINIESRGTLVEADTERGQGPSEIKLEPKKGRVTILTLEMLRVLVQDPEFEIQVTEAEIMQRSKGDGLSKAIFILQSSWFIIQCIVRIIQFERHGLTQLELTTLALASLNGITFILWWDKPLGAQAIVRVYLKRKLTDAERNVEEPRMVNSWRSKFFRDIAESFEVCSTRIRDLVLCRLDGRPLTHWLMVPLMIFMLLFFPFLTLWVAFVYTIIDLTTGSTSFPADATHVPTFYVPKHQHSKVIHISTLLLCGTIFGGIHCFAGRYLHLAFPTSSKTSSSGMVERLIWDIISMFVTAIPIGTAFLSFSLGFIVKIFLVMVRPSSHAHIGMVQEIVILVYPVVAAAYACARLILLGLALAALPYLPQSAFCAVDWSRFYVHFS